MNIYGKVEMLCQLPFNRLNLAILTYHLNVSSVHSVCRIAYAQNGCSTRTYGHICRYLSTLNILQARAARLSPRAPGLDSISVGAENICHTGHRSMSSDTKCQHANRSKLMWHGKRL